MTELTQGPGKDYFRPNFWPNTPDINPWSLQSGHEPTFLVRYFMAATLSANYGLYGPVFEYMVHEANPGKEEYWDSEKYEVRHWDWTLRNKLTHVITKVNQIRKDNPALHSTYNFENCSVENDQLFAWFKQDPTGENNLLFVVNLDPYYTQSGWVQVPLNKLGIHEGTGISGPRPDLRQQLYLGQGMELCGIKSICPAISPFQNRKITGYEPFEYSRHLGNPFR